MKLSRVHVGLIAVQMMFGTLPLTGQIAMESISPIGLATLRIVGAALVLGLVAGKKLFIVRRSDLPWLALFAALGVVGNQLLFLMGLARSTQINASILITTIPVFTVGFALLLRREKSSPVKLAGVGIGLVGALFLTGVERLELSNDVAVGNMMILVNASLWSLHMVLARPILERLGPVVVTAWMFIIGSVVMIPLGAGSVISALGEATGRSWLAAGWVVAVPTILAYLINMWALRKISASAVAIYVYLQPVIAGVLAWLVADEMITPRTGIGALAIFAGVALVQVGSDEMLRRRPLSARRSDRGPEP
jgi:drug/metabolite transporter (DMT)-like permease